MNKDLVLTHNKFKDRIYTIRRQQVMLDRDLAHIYQVETKRLNEQVSRNKARFPLKFMFELNQLEKDELVAKCDHLKPLKFSSSLPYVFTEHGIAMLSSILRSDIAILVSIQIIEAFIEMRNYISDNSLMFKRMDIFENRLLVHDKKFDEIFDAIQNNEIKPNKGIFFDGEVFDAYKFISNIIRFAKKSIILIDNYVDDSVLTILNKRAEGVFAKVYTKNISKELSLDLKKYNSQFQEIIIEELGLKHQ